MLHMFFLNITDLPPRPAIVLEFNTKTVMTPTGRETVKYTVGWEMLLGLFTFSNIDKRWD